MFINHLAVHCTVSPVEDDRLNLIELGGVTPALSQYRENALGAIQHLMHVHNNRAFSPKWREEK
ncbi:hypothetical protein [Sedimenticola sp.]|uniref:hypothetical protein n=1 Tax=Sedimenticola sp. TaxID=1940285 RepID=UPI002588A628|nr:hypothetical protein [Sedimenticola sp.]MCW8904354.1 hypothetical protein [Sedimenticola sp.]